MVMCFYHCRGILQELQEQPPIADFLSRQLNGFQVCGMFGEARMDGGDILRLGNIFFVARSKRTNDAGIDTPQKFTHTSWYMSCESSISRLKRLFTSHRFLPHQPIKSSSTAEGFLSADDFGELPEGSQIIFLPEEEVYGCNTIGLGNGKVLIAEGYPSVLETVQELGLEPIVLDMSQIREADGSITCCTLFF